MRITVLGGTRFIGPFVVQHLVARGHSVTVVHRGEHERDDLGDAVRHVHVDRRELGAVMGQVGDADVALDMAPFTEADMRVALDALRGHVGRVVAISSADVYRPFGGLNGIEESPLPSAPCVEDSPLRTVLYPYRHQSNEGGPEWLQDYDKIPVERLVLGDSYVRGTVLRLGAVYGPGDNQRRLRNIVASVDEEREVMRMEDTQSRWLWPFVYVENAAAAIALAVGDERASGRVYNVGPRRTPSFGEFTEAAARALGWRGRIEIVPDGTLDESAGAMPGADLRHDVDLRTERIRSELGFTEPVAFEEGIARAAEWERAATRD